MGYMSVVTYLLAIALVFIGFITNAVPWTSFNFGTLVVDILYGVIGVAFLLRLPKIDRARLRELRVPLILYGLFAAWCVFLVFYGDNALRDRIMGFRNNVVYPAIWIVLALSAPAVSIRKIGAVIFYCGLVTCVLAIVQAFFSESLPELLLTLHGTDQHFGFYGTNIFRVTGLVGNPLVFSGFSSFLVLMGYMFLGFQPRRAARWLLWIPAIAMYYTYTRTSNYALLLVWGFAWSFWTVIPWWRRGVRVLLVLGFLLVMKYGTFFGPNAFQNSFFLNRMAGTEVTSQASTVAHVESAKEGLREWVRKSVCGLGIGSQGYSVKDHTGTFAGDGVYLAMLLETGGVGFLLLVGVMAWFFVRTLIRFSRASRWGPEHRMYGTLLLVFGYFGMANVLNSAFTARTNLCLFWMLIGLMFARSEDSDEKVGCVSVVRRAFMGSGRPGSGETYLAELARGPRREEGSLRALVRSVWKNRSLFLQMTRRNVEQRYRGSTLGLVWSFVQPLMMLCVYTFVFSVVFKSRWGVDAAVGDSKGAFAVIMFCGMSMFNLFSEAVNNSCCCITGNPNFVKKVIFPLEILPAVQVATTFILGTAWFVLLFIGTCLILHTQNWTMLLLPVVMIPHVVFTLGIAYFVASLGVYVRDTLYVVGVVLQVLFFATPIFYPITAVPERFRWVLELNPLTTFIEQARNVFLYGRLPGWTFLALATAVALLVLQLGYFFFVRTKRGFADVL